MDTQRNGGRAPDTKHPFAVFMAEWSTTVTRATMGGSAVDGTSSATVWVYQCPEARLVGRYDATGGIGGNTSRTHAIYKIVEGASADTR
jgi:hypothetical protein